MKLSEAIRLGAMLKPQGHMSFLFQGRTCALGAALDAHGALDGPDPFLDRVLESLYPWLVADGRFPCPACDRLSAYLAGTIAHLNDSHEWTREQIADWVETIEPERQPAPESATSDDAVRLSVEQPVAATRA